MVQFSIKARKRKMSFATVFRLLYKRTKCAISTQNENLWLLCSNRKDFIHSLVISKNCLQTFAQFACSLITICYRKLIGKVNKFAFLINQRPFSCSSIKFIYKMKKLHKLIKFIDTFNQSKIIFLFSVWVHLRYDSNSFDVSLKRQQ